MVALSDEVVPARTRLGQIELVSPSGRLEQDQWRLLGVVTGYTPLGVVADLARDAPDARASIEGLVQLGLVELVADRARRERKS
jgi:hypothetical protein